MVFREIAIGKLMMAGILKLEQKTKLISGF